jgi:hypothetical protein
VESFRSFAAGGVLDLIDIAVVCVLVWALFVTCVLALLKAAKVGDEVIEAETRHSPMPGHPGWRPVAPATIRRRRGPAAERYVGTRPAPRR